MSNKTHIILLPFIVIFLFCCTVPAAADSLSKSNGFTSIEKFSNKLEALNEYWEKITKGNTQARKASGDIIPFGNTQLTIMSALAQTAEYQEQNAWSSSKGTDPKKHKTIKKSITKEGQVYHYTLEAIRNDGFFDSATQGRMRYDSGKKLLDVSKKETNIGKRRKGEWNGRRSQCYIDESGALFFSGISKIHTNGGNSFSKLVAYFDGKELYYARIQSNDNIGADLSMDLFEKQPENWKQLLQSDKFVVVFSYDGQNLTYTKNDTPL